MIKPAVMACVLVACGGPSAKLSTPAGGSPAVTEAAVKQWVREVADGYADGDPSIFDVRLDPDGVFVASDPQEVWNTPDYLAAHHKMLNPGNHWHITNRDVRVATAPDGHSAWMTDFLDWDFGDGTPHPFRWTAVLIEKDGKLVMSASHVSIAVPNDDAFKLSADGKDLALRDPPDKVDDDAKPLLATFDRDIASPDTWAQDISDRPDVLAIGSDAKEIWTGKTTIKNELLSQISQYHMTLKRHPARAHVVAGGQVGWVMTNVDFIIDSESGKKLTLPLRTLAVYLHEGGAWKMVQLHVSHAVPN